MPKKIRNSTKATAAGAGSGVLATYLALEAQRRYGVPAEVGAVVIGGLFAWLARWAAKLDPAQ